MRDRVAAVALLAALLTASVAAAGGDVERGRQLFKDQGCPQCHGFGGRGDGYLLPMLKQRPEMHDWTDAKQMEQLDDDFLAEIIEKGGEPLGKSKVMLRYSHKLDREQIRDLVAFIRSLAR